MKTLLITPHFAGHRLAMEQLYSKLKDSLPFINPELVVVDHSTNTSNNPKEFVFTRASQVLPWLLRRKDISLVIYDFFSVEGLVLALKSGIPSVCCIPAVMSEYYNLPRPDLIDPWMKSIQDFSSQWNVSLPTPYLVSDGFLFPGTKQLVWNFPSLLTPDSRCLFDPSFHFVGASRQDSRPRRPLVYVSFGTVVPHLPGESFCRPFLLRLISLISKDPKFSHLSLIISYPYPVQTKTSRVEVVSYCNQVEILKEAQLFITHGGGNSLQEAIACQTPVMVIPVFGDQFVTARRVVENRIGTCPVSTSDFGHSTDMLPDFRGVIDSLDVHLLAAIDPVFQENIQSLSLRPSREIFPEAVDVIGSMVSFDSVFQPGDLVYGTTPDRVALAPSLRIGITRDSRYLLYHELGLPCPGAIDQVNDVIRQTPSSLPPSINRFLTDYLQPTTRTPDHPELIRWCHLGIDWCLDGGNRIHFAIKDYNPRVNLATHSELLHLAATYPCGHPRVIMWIWSRNASVWIPSTWNPSRLNEVRKSYLSRMDEILPTVTHLVRSQSGMVSTAWIQSRVKSTPSAAIQLLTQPVLPDWVGIRIIYPWVDDLRKLAELLAKELSGRLEYTERNRVGYLYVPGSIEIQFWPTVLYHCFEYEHSRIYKPKTGLTSDAIKNSEFIRTTEHSIQDLLEEYGSPELRLLSRGSCF